MSADGSWNITLATPMGPQQMTGTFTTAGDVLTGKVESPMGSEDITGTASGETIKWSMSVTKPMPLTLDFDATVDGDTMTGTCKLGMFGNAGLAGTRV